MPPKYVAASHDNFAMLKALNIVPSSRPPTDSAIAGRARTRDLTVRHPKDVCLAVVTVCNVGSANGLGSEPTTRVPNPTAFTPVGLLPTRLVTLPAADVRPVNKSDTAATSLPKSMLLKALSDFS